MSPKSGVYSRVISTVMESQVELLESITALTAQAEPSVGQEMP